MEASPLGSHVDGRPLVDDEDRPVLLLTGPCWPLGVTVAVSGQDRPR
jgi:hypothetical protein